MKIQGLIFDMRSICGEIFEQEIINQSLRARVNAGSGSLVELEDFWRFAVKGRCPLDERDVGCNLG